MLQDNVHEPTQCLIFKDGKWQVLNSSIYFRTKKPRKKYDPPTSYIKDLAELLDNEIEPLDRLQRFSQYTIENFDNVYGLKFQVVNTIKQLELSEIIDSFTIKPHVSIMKDPKLQQAKIELSFEVDDTDNNEQQLGEMSTLSHDQDDADQQVDDPNAVDCTLDDTSKSLESSNGCFGYCFFIFCIVVFIAVVILLDPWKISE